MYISSISIKNYRNYGQEPFTMELKKFTTIIGENNIGKSNLLESIGLILSQDITMFKKRMLQVDDINYKTREKFKKQILDENISSDQVEFPEVKVELTFEGMNQKQKSVVGDWFCDKSMKKAKLTYLFRPRIAFNRKSWVLEQRESIKELTNKEETENPVNTLNLIEFPLKQYEYILYGGNIVSNKCDPYFLRMLKLEVLDALRDAKRELIANGDHKLLYKILNQNNEAYTDIKGVLNSLEEKIIHNEQLHTIKTTLEGLMNKLSLQEIDGSNNADFKFSSPETSEIIKKLSLIYGKNPISIERNGLGRNNILYISLILSHLADSEDTNDIYFRLVGIEEPEAHLHPHLQKHLSKNIESINQERDDLQIIITSHSTHISSALNLDNLSVLYNDRNKLKNHYVMSGFNDKKEGRDHKRYLSKYLDATNSSMFYSRKLILVEGISEQILIPHFFRIEKNKTLERIGCNLINVNGVAFKHFLEIIKNGYFIKCAVLTDSDAGKRTENRAPRLKEIYEGETIKVEINSDTFEKEIISANTTGEGKGILLDTLISTRPKKGEDYKKSLGEKPIEANEFFSMIEDYKAEFAFNLTETLSKQMEGFSIPKYIEDAFDFVEGQ